MLAAYLRSTGNIKAKVGSRSSLKSQIRRAESLCAKKENSGQSEHRLTSSLKIQGRFSGVGLLVAVAFWTWLWGAGRTRPRYPAHGLCCRAWQVRTRDGFYRSADRRSAGHGIK